MNELKAAGDVQEMDAVDELCGRVMALADMSFGQMAAAAEAERAIGDGSGGDDGEGDSSMGMMRGAADGDGEQILPGRAWRTLLATSSNVF